MKILLACLTVGIGLFLVPPTSASAAAGKITAFTATPTKIATANGSVTLSVTLSASARCNYSVSPPMSGLPVKEPCGSGTSIQEVVVPLNSGATSVLYTFTVAVIGGTSSAQALVKVKPGAGTAPLFGAQSTVSNGTGSCALTTSGGVVCWGYGTDGELGNGVFYKKAPLGSATPVQVVGVGGTGTLTGVASVVPDAVGYCALLVTGGVDCWGGGAYGVLGNGGSKSAAPVRVVGVGGSGYLSGVTSLAGDGANFCAVLDTGGVDCWGDGENGALGNGQTGSQSGFPSPVLGLNDTGMLSGVAAVSASVSPVNYGFDEGTYCAYFTSGGLACWGSDALGQVGNGAFAKSVTAPAAVVGVGGSGTLGGVVSLTSDGNDFCALLDTSGVDCWGSGQAGQLGGGSFYSAPNYGSAAPVVVVGVGGSGTLVGVASLTTDFGGYCALLTSAEVDCWGGGASGQLGNGTFYTSGNQGSAVPVQVVGVGDTGVLGGVTYMAGDSGGYCAIRAAGHVTCWGYGEWGQLGDGSFYKFPNYGSATPVTVMGVGDSGMLSGATSLAGEPDSANTDPGGFCAVLSLGQIACWGVNNYGQLGGGFLYGNDKGSAAPVQVVS